MSAPSLERKSFDSRHISYAARVVRSFGCCARMTASARRSSARRSSNDIVAGAALCTDAIVRRLRRDPDVERMRLAEARAGDANEPCLRAELIDRRRADVLHSGAQAAHQLVDERTKRPLRIHVTLDSFGHELGEVADLPLAVAVA